MNLRAAYGPWRKIWRNNSKANVRPCGEKTSLLVWSAAAQLLEMAHADPHANTYCNRLLESAVKKYLQEVRPRVVLDHIMPFIALDDRQLAAGGHECQQIAADNNEACC